MKNFFSKYRTFRTAEEKKQLRIELLLGLLSGIMLGISFPPLPLPYFLFAALVPYFYVLEKRDSLAGINRFTYFTFFFFNLSTLYWVGSWTKDADTFFLISGTVLMFFNPILFLIPSTLYYFAKKKFGLNKSIFLLPFFWVFYEFMYSVTDFRFPWLTIANGLSEFTLFIQIADIAGAYGISLILLFTNIFLYKLFSNWKKNRKLSYIYLSALIILILFPLGYGSVKIGSYNESKRKLKIGLIQPNLNPWKKWEAGSLDELLDIYLDLSNNAVRDGAELIIWPESALPVYLLTGSYDCQVNRIHHFLDSNNVYLLTGMPDATFYYDSTKAPDDAKRNRSGTYYTSYNSLLFFTPHTKAVQKYGKIKLVPFGEKTPLVEYIPFLGDLIKWNVGITSWNTGKGIKTFPMRSNTNIGGVICIESIYPDFCAQFVQKGAELLAVVTNDSWYGNSSGPYQHKEFAALRAVENRRALVRAANGGISCLIDPLGRTLSETKMFSKDYLVVDAPLEKELTFYTKYPLLIPYLCITVTVMLVLYLLYGRLISRFSKK